MDPDQLASSLFYQIEVTYSVLIRLNTVGICLDINILNKDEFSVTAVKYGPRHDKVSKVAKIRNRYNQVPHLTQDTNGKVTNSQKTPQTRAKRSALSQQVTTKHI